MSTSGVLSTNPDTTCTVVSGSRSSSPNTRSPRNTFAMRKRGVVGTKTVDGVSEKLVLPAPTVRIATTSREAGRRAIDAGSPLLSSLVISQSHSPLLGKEGGGGASFTSLTRRSSKSPKIDDGAQHRRHRRTTPDERQKVEGLVSSFENLVRRLSISGGTPPPPQLGSSAMAECGDGHASGRATTDLSPATSPPLIIPTTSNTPKSILSPSGGGMLSPSSPHRRMSTVRLDSANMNASGADQFGRYLDSMLNTLQQGGDVAEEDERQRSVEEFSHNMRELFLLAQSCSEVLREDGGDVVTNSNSSGKGSPPLAPTARQRSNDISQLDFPYIDSVTSPPFAEIHRLPGCLPDGYAGQMLQLRPPGLSSAEDHELNADRHNLHHGCFLRTRRESNSTNAESVVNEFSVVRTLGYGTTSKVRLCINLQTNEEVAMKSMNRPQVGPKYALLHPRSESSSEVGDSEENQGSSNGEASVTSSESDDELLYSLSSPIMRRDQPTDFTRTASLKRSSRDAKTMKAASSENLLHHDLTELADVSASGCTTPVHHVMRSSTMCPSSIAAVMPPSEREIRFLRRMHHPHVVCLHEVIDDEEENVVHLILTYAPKGPITHVHPYDDFVGRAPCDLVRPIDRFVRYLQQIVAAVDYMHSQRIVHNDLKPDNILRTAKDDVIITDFGESVLVPKSGHHNNTTSVQVNPARWGSSVVDAEATLDGSLHFGNNSSCSTVNPDSSVYISAGVGDDGKLIHRVGAGTPAFAAPEVVEHNECSYKTDVWSIGVLIYSMLCGRLPFAAPTLPATFEAIIQCEPQFPSLEEIDISSDLTTESYEQWKELCRTLLAKNPQDRLTTGELKTHPLLTAHPSYVLERGRGSRSKVKTGAKSFRKEASDAMSSAAGTPSLPPSSPILVNRPRSGQLDRHHPAPAPRVVVSVPTFDEPPPLGDANASSATLPPNSEVHDIDDPSSPNSCPASSSSTQHRKHNSPSLRSSPLRRPTSSAHHSNQASPPTKPEADEQRRLSTRSHLHNKMEAAFRSTEDRMMDYSSGTSIKGPSSGATCSTFGDSDRLTSPDSHASPLIRPRREFSRRQTLVTIVEPLQSIEISTNFVEKRTM